MYVCMYVCRCVCVCMYVCMHACMHACMYVYSYVQVYVCIYLEKTSFQFHLAVCKREFSNVYMLCTAPDNGSFASNNMQMGNSKMANS